MSCKVGSILVEPQPWKCYRNAVRRCRKMSLPLPIHFSDLTLKDPDAAVCSCMARKCFSAADWTRLNATGDTLSKGIIGCGMTHYSPLGTEMWGRSLLVFHPFVASAPGIFVLRLQQVQGTIVTDGTVEGSIKSHATNQSSDTINSSVPSNAIDVGDGVDLYLTEHVDSASNTDEDNALLNRKRKSASSEISTALSLP